MNPLDDLVRAQIALFLLECARIAGVVIIAPLSWVQAPARVKVGLVVALAFVAHGLEVRVALPSSTLEVAFQLGYELLVGVALGFVVRLVVAIAEIAGDIMSPAMGMGVATAFDPTTQSQQSVIATMLRHLMILIALAIGVHRVLFEGLLASFSLLPVGQVTSPGQVLPLLVTLSSAVLAAGVRIALPLVAVLFMTQIALAFIARAAPQMQVFNVGFAVMLAVGLLLLAILMPDFTRNFVAELSQVGSRLEDVLGALGAVP